MTFCMERHHREYKILHRMGHLFFAEIATIILAPYMVFCNKISSTSSICCFLTRYGKIFATTSCVWPCLFCCSCSERVYFTVSCMKNPSELWRWLQWMVPAAIVCWPNMRITSIILAKSFFGLPFWEKKCTFSQHTSLYVTFLYSSYSGVKGPKTLFPSCAKTKQAQ